MAQYTNDLHEVLASLTAGVSRGKIAMAGPTLYGELPRGENVYDALFETYVGVNERAAAQHNITYLNMRDVFFSIIEAARWDRASGLLTLEDRVHHNECGSRVVASILTRVLLTMYAHAID